MVRRVCVGWGHGGNLPACRGGTREGFLFIRVGMIATVHSTVRPPLRGPALADKI